MFQTRLSYNIRRKRDSFKVYYQIYEISPLASRNDRKLLRFASVGPRREVKSTATFFFWLRPSSTPTAVRVTNQTDNLMGYTSQRGTCPPHTQPYSREENNEDGVFMRTKQLLLKDRCHCLTRNIKVYFTRCYEQNSKSFFSPVHRFCSHRSLIIIIISYFCERIT
jgi:hypothetical protein